MGYNNESGVTHFVTVGIDQEKEFEAADVFFFTFDGEDIPVGSLSSTLNLVEMLAFMPLKKKLLSIRGTAEYTWTSPDSRATITREAHKRAFAHVEIEGLFKATFFPRIESRIQLDPLGKYLDMDMDTLAISRHSHGVLGRGCDPFRSSPLVLPFTEIRLVPVPLQGQMFRPDIIERKNAVTTNLTGHEFLVEGKTADYRVSSLTSYDSTFNQFNLAAGVTVRNFNVIEDGAKLAARKMLTSASGLPGADGSTIVSARCSQDRGSLVCA
ncbi:hypothetical protein KFL_004310120 [Klebsormidium nitens]|uniref:Uncharacterized protein n=1 Tax=Klebsormidium nitens TaxID=105231 RepID=A0A1Y1IBY1_KLENI|nr:hypothetical protein KFL_004310120 [Klebsormidium nitens]|eukprot:GAQ88474.1 hypothetical protein KFL_004310120 [Klebsormidium nitens]